MDDESRTKSRREFWKLSRKKIVWYFAWVLGAGLIGCFGILNAMWFELHADDERDWAAVEHDY